MPTEDLSYLNGAADHHLPHPHSHHHPHHAPHRPRYYGGGPDGPHQHAGKSSSSHANNLHDPHLGYPHHRPPSTSNVPSAARTTATSRRGGRTRSRSPPVMGVPGRLPLDGSQQPPPLGGGPDNPSSAAAAAAAAAKAFRKDNLGGDPAASGGYHPRDAGHGYKPSQPYPGGGSGTGGASNWPAGDDSRGAASSYRYASGGPGGANRGEGQGPGAGYLPPPYRSGGSGYYSRGDERGQPSYGEQQRRDRGSSSHSSHYDNAFRGGLSSSHQPPSRSYQPQDYHHRYGRDSSSSSKGHSRASGGGRSLVIGGTTPIHVPKPNDGPHPASTPPMSRSQQREGSASSVFRGRPGGDSTSASRTKGPAASATAAALDDDNSPQKILLSLRTPTSSFEEKGSDQVKKTGNPPLSPSDPPQIQNSSQQRQQDQLFDPQRSPDAQKLAASIENAPSFSLFNQSFDSFGDGHYFNVDASLQNDSFGMVRVSSVDNDGSGGNILQSASVGNFSQQLLASGSGALTLGYSPVNSFGNVSVSGGSRRGGTTLVVGGPEPRPTSPTQVLGMYRSYSAGGGGGTGRAQSSLEDSHLRMSLGSFGAPSMAYSRSYGGEPAGVAPYYYAPAGPTRSHDNVDKLNPSFHTFLRKHRNAFKDCTFLLPGLKASLLETPGNEAGDSAQSSPEGSGNTKKSTSIATSVFGDPTPHETAIARRRVECSIFAFGGNPNQDRAAGSARAEKSADRNSIFRGKEETDRSKSASVTPSPAGSRFHSRSKTRYEEGLPSRYYENVSRLSWEFEESPPVEISHDEDSDSDRGEHGSATPDGADSKDMDHKRADGDDGGSRAGGDNDESASKRTTGSPQVKMRYRCKLCGQPKQNHTCPYQQSLARSIGIMVFPAVNAFTASEPGTIAPALSDMNNFTDTQKDEASNESSPNRPTPDRPPHRRVTTSGTVASTTQVTPESMRSSPRQLHSPISFAATPGPSPGRRNGAVRPATVQSSGRKRSYTQVIDADGQSDLLFLEAMELKPEQFRLVSLPSSTKTPDAFNYPSLPLPYAQRKRLSDNLFSLSNEVPKLTDECAQVLREAREKDMWDLAVAELMTQVIVIIHCPEGDSRFEGLRQYLLTLGIAC